MRKMKYKEDLKHYRKTNWEIEMDVYHLKR